MKRKLSSFWRLAIALVLCFGMAMAFTTAPVAAGESQCGCVAVAPDFTVLMGTTLYPDGFWGHGAGCDTDCECTVDYSQVDTSVSGNYTYTVTCDNGICQDSDEGEIEVLDAVNVSIIECPSDPESPWAGGIVPFGAEFVVKAQITNCNYMELSDVEAIVTFDPEYFQLLSPSDTIALGALGPPANLDWGDFDSNNCYSWFAGEMNEVAWTFKCIKTGDSPITVKTNHTNEWAPCSSDICEVEQRTDPNLVVTLSSPCEWGTNCGTSNEFTVTALVLNDSDTPVDDVDVTINKVGNATLKTGYPNPADIAHLEPGESGSVSWVFRCTAEGDVTFSAVTTATNSWTEEMVGPFNSVNQPVTSQKNILVDVLCIQPLNAAGQPACTPCPVDNNGNPYALVSGDPNGVYDQKFTVRAKIENQSAVNRNIKVKLNKPVNAAWALGTAEWHKFNSSDVETDNGTIAHTDGEFTLPGQLCSCCHAEVVWTLQCDGAVPGGPSAEALVVTVTQTSPTPVATYSNMPCNPAYLVQEDKAHLATSTVAYVDSCADPGCDITKDDVIIDTVSSNSSQAFDVLVTLSNTGDADANNVYFDVSVSGPASCTGTWDHKGPYTVLANSALEMWLSDIIGCEPCYCTGEGEVLITIGDVEGIDENTCEAIPSEDVPEPCELRVNQCNFKVELINPECGMTVCPGSPFAVKARLTNAGLCNLEDVDVTLMWEGCGDVNLGVGENATKHIDEILPDPSGNPAVFEVSWMVQCACPGDVTFWVCVKTKADQQEPLRLQVMSNTSTVHQQLEEAADITMEIVSPDNFDSFIATGQEFAVTAIIVNEEMFSTVTIDDVDLTFEPDAVMIVEAPQCPFSIPPQSSKTITWTVQSTQAGLVAINATVHGASDSCHKAHAWTFPLLAWQYPAAHLDAEITSVTPMGTTIVSGTDFEVNFKVTNTGEADATEVKAILTVSPDGSVLPAEGINNSFVIDIGTIPGHGSAENIYTGTYSLHGAAIGNSNITIRAEGYDEYGWHKKQVCQSTGNFLIEKGAMITEDLYGNRDDGHEPLIPILKGVQVGMFIGEASGLIGPFNFDTPISWVDFHENGSDDAGTMTGIGIVVPNLDYTGCHNLVTMLQHLMPHGPSLLQMENWLQVQGINKDVMIYFGHIIMDESVESSDIPWGESNVAAGYLQIINGHFTGSSIEFTCEDGDDGVFSWLDGEYCSTMAQEALRPIDAKFIEPASVTVNQLAVTADLSVSKTVDEPEVDMRENVMFTITVTNNGPVTATGVRVTDMLPAELGFVGYSTTNGWYDVTSGVWTVGSLANGASVTLCITATVNTVGTATNTAYVSHADQSDPTTSNNAATISVVGDEPPLLTQKTLNLYQGFNLISLPLIPDHPELPTILSGVDYSVVAMFDSTWPYPYWFTYGGGAPTPPFTEMVDGYGYWVNMATNDTLSFSGQELVGGPLETPPSYNVVSGWNLIGFKSVVAKTPAVYLAGIAGKYVAIVGYNNATHQFYIVGSPGHTYLEPGNGYWLAVKSGDSGTIFP